MTRVTRSSCGCGCGGEHGALLVVENTSAPVVRFASGSAEEAFAEMRIFRREFADSIGSLRSGLLNEEGTNAAIEKLLRDRYTDAYRQGLGSLGVTRFGDFDRRFVDAAVRQEMRFVRQFTRDVVNGTGAIAYGERAAYYGRGYEAMYQVGQVQALPWETDIYWTLGVADHCLDCVSLSEAGPFSKATLPVVPGSGGTKCLFNCGCQLTFKQRPPRTSTLDSVSGTRDAIEVAAGPVPDGKRLPTVDELDAIRDFWGDVQYHRTATRFSPPELKGAHVAARRDANSALIDFLDEGEIYWTRGMEDSLFNPPPGGGVGGGFPAAGRTGIASSGTTIEGAGRPVIDDPELHREPARDLGGPEE